MRSMGGASAIRITATIFAAWLIVFLAGTGRASAQFPVPPPPGDSLALISALEGLEQIRVSGGWPEVPAGATLRLGDRDARVALLRGRLEISGDLQFHPGGSTAAPSDPILFDESLDRAVRKFQGRHALDVDGAVGAGTRAALNVSVEARIQQIEVNLDRRREFQPVPATGPFHILVNIPGFQAFVFEEGEETRVHRAIVGRVDRPTPLLTGEIEHVVLSPYWNVPSGILANDKFPEIRSDPSYLARSRISVIDRDTGQAVSSASIDWTGTTVTEFSSRYWLRQAPGPGNALGFVKFIFPNSYDVFLHDTPDRHLFDRGRRALSSGCMRVEGALALAERLLAQVPGWGVERVHQVANEGTEVWVRLPNPVPIQTVYWTAWVAPDGTLNLVDDLYGLDARRTVAMLEDGMSECPQINEEVGSIL